MSIKQSSELLPHYFHASLFFLFSPSQMLNSFHWKKSDLIYDAYNFIIKGNLFTFHKNLMFIKKNSSRTCLLTMKCLRNNVNLMTTKCTGIQQNQNTLSTGTVLLINSYSVVSLYTWHWIQDKLDIHTLQDKQ